MKKREAFTLIELIAVLVILAILALIVTPLVLNIVKKARVSANKRSIDAYGRSVELAIADYLLDKGEFPTSVEQLTIEYTGDEVVCNTTILNEDTSVYLAECTVGGRTVSGYTYGRYGAVVEYEEYTLGTIIEYRGERFYVIEDSASSNSTVILLKSEALSYAEVQAYSDGIGINIYDVNGYGVIPYHSNSSDYGVSYIKIIVDNWANDKFGINGYKEARLVTLNELRDNLGYDMATLNVSNYVINPDYTPSWVHGYNYSYWTMSPKEDLSTYVWYVENYPGIRYNDVNAAGSAIRPVIVLSKSAL